MHYFISLSFYFYVFFLFFFFFFFQAEDGIRDLYVTGVQTCALPIFFGFLLTRKFRVVSAIGRHTLDHRTHERIIGAELLCLHEEFTSLAPRFLTQIGRASCRERV